MTHMCKKTRRNRHNKNANESPKQIIIVRFVSRLVRNEIFASKSSLKDTPIAITEHLTATNLSLLKAAQKLVGVKKSMDPLWESADRL